MSLFLTLQSVCGLSPEESLVLLLFISPVICLLKLLICVNLIISEFLNDVLIGCYPFLL